MRVEGRGALHVEGVTRHAAESITNPSDFLSHNELRILVARIGRDARRLVATLTPQFTLWSLGAPLTCRSNLLHNDSSEMYSGGPRISSS